MHVTAGIVSSMTGKFFIATAVLVVTQFVGEMFPTLLRNTSIGISSMSSRLASALAPFLIFAGMFFLAGRYEFLKKHTFRFSTVFSKFQSGSYVSQH